MFKNAIYSTLGFALNVTICKSLHFALLHLDILMDYIINCITHETCKVNCARLCTIEHMLHIQVWKILQFAVFVAPKLLNFFLKNMVLHMKMCKSLHIAHFEYATLQYIVPHFGSLFCTLWIFQCAKSCTLQCNISKVPILTLYEKIRWDNLICFVSYEWILSPW